MNINTEKELKEMENLLSQVNNCIRDIGSETDKKFKNINNDISVMEDEIKKKEKDLNILLSGIQNLNIKIKSVEKSLRGLNRRL